MMSIWHVQCHNGGLRYCNCNISYSTRLVKHNGAKCFMNQNFSYHKVASSNTSRLEAHSGFFRLIMKGIFGPYVLWPLDKKLIF